MPASARDVAWMHAATSFAKQGLGRTWPNPSVACLIVKDDILIARGRTADGGRPHAETQALGVAGAAAQGATAYVTLEPCAHHGQTPPCAQALITAGVARVVIGAHDPDPRVDGAGADMLLRAGVELDHLPIDPQDNPASGFLHRVRTGRPVITLKSAATLDGRIATATGESRWITGPHARRRVHALRSMADAVLVGAGTLRADDPMLDVRDLGTVAQPVRIVLDTKLSTRQDARIVSTAAGQQTWIYCSVDAPSDRREAMTSAGVHVIPVGMRNGALDVVEIAKDMGDRGLTHVMAECGGTLAASLIGAGLVHALHHFTAGKQIGAEGLPVLGQMGLDHLQAAPDYQLVAMHIWGNDTETIWTATSTRTAAKTRI